MGANIANLGLARASPMARQWVILGGMVELTAHESRVLGVLVEKALTTPDQYPLSLNSLTNGANQKNNRYPVMDLLEDEVLTAAIGLRQKGLLIQVETAGGRVSKYKHAAVEKLGINAREVVVLAELLLRGPQTPGELRARASRMCPMETVEFVQSTLDQLAGKPEPLVKRIAAAVGDRAERYVQLLCLDAAAEIPASAGSSDAPAGASTLSQRVTALEWEIARLKEVLKKLCEQLGVEGQDF